MRPHLLALALLAATAAHAAVDSTQLAAIRELLRDRANLPAAQVQLEQLAAANPDHADTISLLGEVYVRRDETEKAVKTLERAVQLAPNSSTAFRRLGDAYGRSAQKAGMFSKMSLAGKCRDAYVKAVELDPKNIDARFALLGYYRQAPGIVGGGVDKALAQADEIIKLDPVRGKIAKAGILAGEKKYDEAFALFEESLQSNPNDYAALYQVGRLAAETGQRLDRGLEALQKCLAQTPPEGAPPHPAAHWRIGNIHEKKGDKASARHAYQAALALDPKHEQAAAALKKL